MTARAPQSSGLRRLEDMLMTGLEHEAIIARPRMCDSSTLPEVLCDVAALANSRIEGQRVIVFGVRKEGAAATLASLTDAEHAFGAKLERVIAKNLEPQLQLRYVRWRMRGHSLGVLLIDHCEDAPYLVRKDAPPHAHSGDAWTRRRGKTVRMRRSELDRLYAEKLTGPLYDGRVLVQFAADPPCEFLRLTAIDVEELPSQVAARKLQELIAARQLAMNAASNELTYISRLSQARIMGCDTPYADKGLATLKIELGKVQETFRAADEQFQLERQAHRVNLQIALDGDCDIECASLVLHLPANVGIEVAEPHAVATAVNDGVHAARPPHIEVAGDVIRISETYERLRAKRRVNAFRHPLRVIVDARAAGHKVPLHYRLHGRNLRYPVYGKLYIVCAT